MEKLFKGEIPIINPDKERGGYWEIYPNRKIWHQEKNMSLNSLYEEQKENRKANSRFIQLGDGESFEGEFVSVEETTGQFGEVNSYTFLIGEEEKVLNSKSFKLLQGLINAGVKEKDRVRITKKGQGFKTTFEVVKL